MRRKERREEIRIKAEIAKEETIKLWANGIIDLSLTIIEIQKLKQAFEGWATHFQRNLLLNGFKSVIDRYEELIFSIENGCCIHNGKMRKGKDYQNCCGVSYEYTNKLSSRSAIEIIKRNISEEQYKVFKHRIDLLDERFRSVPKTEKWIVNEKGIQKYKKLNYWWFLGLPNTVLK